MKKTDYAYSIIKERIINGTYVPLSELSEELLQKELGCSRTPIREALMRLADSGFIIVYPSKATLVSPVTRELIDEIYEVRLVNEPYICQKASRLIDKDLLVKIRESFVSPPSFNGDAERRAFFVAKDDELHTSILRFCGNAFLIKTMALIYAHNARFRHFSSNPVNDGSITEHVALIDSLLSGDMRQIRKACVAHIEASKKISLNTFVEAHQLSGGSFQGIHSFNHFSVDLSPDGRINA